jgi:hypothetical protein
MIHQHRHVIPREVVLARARNFPSLEGRGICSDSDVSRLFARTRDLNPPLGKVEEENLLESCQTDSTQPPNHDFAELMRQDIIWSHKTGLQNWIFGIFSLLCAVMPALWVILQNPQIL